MRRLNIALIISALLFQQSSAQLAASDSNVLQAKQLLRKAAALVNDVPQMQQESTVANISGQFVRAGDLADALATVRLLKKADEQGLAMGIVAWQLANSGQMSQALSLMQGTESGQDKDVSYENVAQLLVEKGDFNEALKAAYLIKDPHRLGDTLVRLAVVRSKAGDRQSASRALSDALEVAGKSTASDPSGAMIFDQIANAEVEIGETPETAVALQRFQDIAYTRKQAGDTTLLRSLAQTEAQIGNVEVAEQLARTLSGDSADWIYMSISERAAAHGSMGAAFSAALKISSVDSRDGAFREIAMFRQRDGNSDDSFEAINKMVKPVDKAEALAVLALQQAQSGDDTAYYSLNLSKAAADPTPAEQRKAPEVVAVTYGVLGDFVSAEEILKSLQNPESRSWPLWNLTSFLVQRERTQEAIALADEEQSALPKAYALLGTAQGLLDRSESDAKRKNGTR